MWESSNGVLSKTLPIATTSEDVIELAVREHSRFVYAVTYSVLRNHHDAEDATQETFVRLWRHRRRWVLIRDQRAWLARTAWRIALDLQRKRRGTHESYVSLEDVMDKVARLRQAGMGVDEIASHEEMAELLNCLIESLPEELRNALSLSLAEGLSSPEIAAILGIPEGSVRQRLWQARQFLKKKLFVLLEG